MQDYNTAYYDPEKTIVTEVLSFDGAELETSKYGHRTFTTAGTLRVLYFRDYNRFILSLNDWKYVLFPQSEILKITSSFTAPIIYNFPFNQGSFTLSLTKVPYVEAIKNLETIFSYNASFSLENELEMTADKENINPRRTFREHLYGQFDTSLPQISEIPERRQPRYSHEGSERKLSKLSSVKKGIMKATDKLARGLINQRVSHLNMTQIRNYDSLISANDAPTELLWRKDVEELILHDIDGGSRPQEQHSIGERLQEGFQEIRQRLSFRSPVQEDFYQPITEESRLQPGLVDKFKERFHLKTSAEKHEEEIDSDKRTVTEVLYGIKENLAWKLNERLHHHPKEDESHHHHEHQGGVLDTIKRKLSGTEGVSWEHAKTKGMEILYFEGVELERTKHNSHSFQTVGTLRVLYFEDYSRFILFLGDWNYALLQDVSIVRTTPNYIDPVIYKLSTNDGSWTLKLRKVPYIQAVQNFETILMKNTNFSTSEEAHEFGRPSVSRSQLYGFENDLGEASLMAKSNEMMSEDEKLGRIDVVKREILKTTDKIISGLTPNKAENMNLVRIRDYESLLNPTEDSDVSVKFKSRDEIEKIIIDSQEMAHRMREASTMEDLDASERRSVVNTLKEGFEDLKTVMKTTCRSSNADKNYELIIEQDQRATRIAQDRLEHPGLIHRLRDKLRPEDDTGLTEKIKHLKPDHHAEHIQEGPGILERTKTRISDILHIHRDQTPKLGGQEQESEAEKAYLKATVDAFERQGRNSWEDQVVRERKTMGITRRSYGLDEIQRLTVDLNRQGQVSGLENVGNVGNYGSYGSNLMFYNAENLGFGQNYEPLYHYEG